MPLIAIARCGKTADYIESVRRAGGDPWVVDRAADRADLVVRSADALLLTGGDDVRPDLYGAVAHPSFSAAEAGRDEYEIELVSRAYEADVPIFAICRGIQVLNVARGGTLVQDIPTERPSPIPHRLPTPTFAADAVAHAVRVEPDSQLHALLNDGRAPVGSWQVNSRHHQAVDTLGDGLRVTAMAPDGVIEAVEAPARGFCVAVQWHPESFWRTGEFEALFNALVHAGRRRL
jgi:putative glutamine amidotransferase